MGCKSNLPARIFVSVVCAFSVLAGTVQGAGDSAASPLYERTLAAALADFQAGSLEAIPAPEAP